MKVAKIRKDLGVIKNFYEVLYASLIELDDRHGSADQIIRLRITSARAHLVRAEESIGKRKYSLALPALKEAEDAVEVAFTLMYALAQKRAGLFDEARFG